jgi:hypothetical protein
MGTKIAILEMLMNTLPTQRVDAENVKWCHCVVSEKCLFVMGSERPQVTFSVAQGNGWNMNNICCCLHSRSPVAALCSSLFRDPALFLTRCSHSFPQSFGCHYALLTGSRFFFIFRRLHPFLHFHLSYIILCAFHPSYSVLPVTAVPKISHSLFRPHLYCYVIISVKSNY